MLKHPRKAAAREPFSRVDLQKVKSERERKNERWRKKQRG